MPKQSSLLRQKFIPSPTFPTYPPCPPTWPPVPPPTWPPVPDPTETPVATPVMPPMVYVQETILWEYKIVTQQSDDGDVVDEAVLNALGADGWELVGIASRPDTTIYYFKRQKQ